MNNIVRYISNEQEIELSIDIVRSTLDISEKVTDQEIISFMNICKYQQLNPFLKEIYLVKYSSGAAQIITSKEAYMKRAYIQENYDGMRAGIIVLREKEVFELEGSFKLESDILVGGWAEVFVREKQSVITKVSMKEYDKKTNAWNTMPCTMIRKVAIVQALREAFPIAFGGLYVAEEQDMQHITSPEIIDTTSEISDIEISQNDTKQKIEKWLSITKKGTLESIDFQNGKFKIRDESGGLKTIYIKYAIDEVEKFDKNKE